MDLFVMAHSEELATATFDAFVDPTPAQARLLGRIPFAGRLPVELDGTPAGPPVSPDGAARRRAP